jgi:hypothetical protein
MIKSEWGSIEYIVTCDECGHEDILECESWSELMDDIKSDGWGIRNNEGEWNHYCHTCN